MGSYYDPVLIKDKRQQLVELAGSICAACGTKGTVFEFDHIDPDTKAFRLTGSDMTRSWESLLNEFFKCQLLCLDCHKKKTSEERRVAKRRSGLNFTTSRSSPRGWRASPSVSCARAARSMSKASCAPANGRTSRAMTVTLPRWCCKDRARF